MKKRSIILLVLTMLLFASLLMADKDKCDVNNDGIIDDIDITVISLNLDSGEAMYDANEDELIDNNDVLFCNEYLFTERFEKPQ